MQLQQSKEGVAARVLRGAAIAACAVAVAALAALVVVTAVDVAGRYLFNKPLFGAVELSEFLLVFIGFGGLAYAELRDAHITVDFFVTVLPRRVQALLESMAALLGSLFWGFVAWRALDHGEQILEAAEVSINLAVPTYPFYLAVACGSILYALLLARRVVRALRVETA
ncbi:MAG: TRAP transporter small permease [Betaproteobacteria bacterium]|nr:TRAP transporter small permease [Betaproteobacteria bacterium]